MMETPNDNILTLSYLTKALTVLEIDIHDVGDDLEGSFDGAELRDAMRVCIDNWHHVVDYYEIAVKKEQQ